MIDRALFLSILAMDAYNRGYSAALTGLSDAADTELGGAKIIAVSGQANAIAAGFYGLAYDLTNVVDANGAFLFGSGQVGISYRGTDLNLALPWSTEGSDLVNGYGVGTGSPYGPQAALAIELYKAVAALKGSSLFDANILTTGHSLGGGLAGFVADLYGRGGFLYDNMGFEQAARVGYNDSTGFIPNNDLRNLIYGSEMPPSPNEASLHAYATTGEFLAFNRIAQSLPVTYLDSNGGSRNPFTLHSIALQVALQWARANNETDWIPAGKYLWDAFFDGSVASAIDGVSGLIGPHGDSTGVLTMAIAYSALESGVRPFGDVAIKSMFDDASDLGKALADPQVSSSIVQSAKAIASVMVQYAGSLALGKATDTTALQGVVANDGHVLSIDFNPSIWAKGNSSTVITGREELVTRALSAVAQERNFLGLPTGQIRSDLVAGLKWFAQNQGAAYTTPGDLIDRVSFQIANADRTINIPERQAGASPNQLSLFVAGDGNDTIHGSGSNDFVYGGGGNDTILGGAGNDVLAGGPGNDILAGGAGRDFLAGGEGSDTIDLGLDGSAGATISVAAVDATGADDRPTFEINSSGDTDRGIDIEHIKLTDLSDTVNVTYLGNPSGSEAPMGSLSIDFGAAPLEFRADLLDFSQAGRVAGVSNAVMTGDVGVYVDLSDPNHQTVQNYYTWHIPLIGDVHTTGGDLRLQATGANSVVGTGLDDYIVGTGGSRTSGEGYSSLYGGAGNDTLKAAGWETHMFGGAGNDSFKVGASTTIEDAEAHDSITYGGMPIFGGTKQWWMEGNAAYWSPISTLMSAFPVIGAELLYTAAFFIDVATMKFASFQLTASGDLLMSLGWGHGGSAVVKNYHLDLDSGTASAGVVVFESGHGGTTGLPKPSEERFTKFVNLAMKAGFGIGLHGFDPLVLDLNGGGYQLTTQDNSKVYFEFDTDGFAERTGWVRGDDGFLVLDRNGNGVVDDVTEMFGNRTTAGFSALGTYDANGDGRIDASDPVFSQLRVWQDVNQNGVTDAGELKTLAELGIVSISLANAVPADPTAIGGNAIVHTGTFTFADGRTGGIADVALDINETATRWLGDSTVSAAAAALPELKGFGEVKDLRVALTGDASLQAMVSAFAGETTNNLTTLKAEAEAILYKWAGVDGVAATAIGADGFDARKLAFLEKYSGYALMPRDANGAPVTANLAEMESLWADQVTRLTLRLVVQGPMHADFAGISYHPDLDLLVADTPTALKDLYGRILAGLPSDAAAALADWQGWAPLLGAMADGMRRFDANIVRSDYVAAQLLAAIDGTAQPLSFATLAGALGIENLRIGTGADDSLSRGTADGTAIYVGGGGNDVLTGGSGQDVYIFGHDVGHSVIHDEEAKPAGDRIRFAFLNPGDVTMARTGNDLLITVKATGETVLVAGQFAPVVPISSDVLLSSDKGVEEVQFADGTVYGIPEIMTAVGTGTDGNDHMVGTMHSDVLIGGKGDDLLEGGDDADLYVINAGDGHDVISDQQTTPLLRAADLLIFGANVARQDLAFARAGDGGNDLLITIGATGQTVLIQGQFDYTSLGYNDRLAPNSRIEAFAFQDYGDSFGSHDLQQRMIAEATTSGNDTTRGFGDDDVFGESAGNDILIGMDGVDIYHWGAGAGNDTIDEQARYIDIKVGLGGLSLVDGADTVAFDAGIVRSNLIFSRTSAAPDLTITLVSTGETLTVKNQFAGFQTGPLGPQWLDRIEWFQFADGSRLSWQDILHDVTTGGTGNDTLRGDLYADTLDGGPGNDILSGGGLGDTYIFKLGYGHDTIVDDNQFILGSGFVTVDTSPDVLQFGAGIAPSDVHFVRSGQDLILVVGTGGDSVTLQGQDDYFHTGVFGAISYNRIEQVRFADGTIWTWQDLNRFAIADATTPGNDVERGFMMADRFEASAGDDVMMGGDSSDTYVFGHGSGHDIIRESVTNPLYGDDDAVEFAPGITAADVSIQRAGDDLILTLVGTGDTLKIEGEFAFDQWFTWTDVEHFRFADGTEWSKDDIQVRLMQGTPGNDHITGFMTPDTIDGGAGNDLLEGGDGGDTYVFGRGSGHDEIRESVSTANLSEYDTLRFGAGVTLADLGWARAGNDLIVTILDSGDSVRVTSQFYYESWFTWNDIDNFAFADGSSLSRIDVQQILLTGTAGNDHLVGFLDGDTLDGGAGNDLLEGGDGGDTYVFGRGYGQDTIVETLTNANLSEYDTLRFGPGIAQSDLAFTRDGGDLVISILGTADSIRIQGQFNDRWTDVDNFVFADGSSLSAADAALLVLRGTPGDDHLVGFSGDDRLDGGAGNDLLEGGEGADTYVFGRGYGHDIIRDYVWDTRISEDDRLAFGPNLTLADLGFARDGANLTISILGTSDSVTVENEFAADGTTDVGRFVFADGVTLTKTDVQNLLLRGTPGNDHLIGFATADLLTGGAGNDLLEGGAGADTYAFADGSGADTVTDSSGGDILSFAGGLTAGLARFGFADAGRQDLLVSFAGRSETVTVTGFFSGGPSIASVAFDGGAQLSFRQVVDQAFGGLATAGADDISGPDFAATLSGLGGNDTLTGRHGGDLLIGGAGNDVMTGSGGDDVYRFTRGDGNDVVRDLGSVWDGTGGNDTVEFTAGIAPADVTVTESDGGNDLVLTVNAAGGSVTLDDTMTNGDDRIEQVRFADGTIWTHADLVAKAAAGTSGDDTLWGSYDGETIAPGAGNDVVDGRGGDDLLIGGAGNDLLSGSGGNDTYRFARGDGNDVVRDYTSNWSGWGGNDTIEFAAGIAPADITISQADNGNDIVLTVNNAGGSITIDDTMSNGDDRIEQVRFADGTIWTSADIVARITGGTPGNDAIWGSFDGETITGGAGNDTIDARQGDDVIVGGTGDDLLSGSGGNDIYRFTRGDGNDVVRDYTLNWSGWGGNDTIEFTAGIVPSDVTVTQVNNGTDLLLTVNNSGGSILIDDALTNGDDRIEQVRFADGTVWTSDQLVALSFGATDGPDTINGDDGANVISALGGNDVVDARWGDDVIIGGAGDDLLSGSGGNDTYRFARGDGNDVVQDFISNWSGWGGNDSVEFLAGIAPSDVTVAQADSGNDLILTVNNGGGSVRLNDSMTNGDQRIEQVRFADGTIWTHAAMVAMTTGGTAGNDTIWGSYDGETISPGGGNDVVDGRGGDDIIVGGPGDDLLSGSGGNDTYRFGRGDGNDIVQDYTLNWSGWGGFETVEFLAGISPADVTVSQADSGNDLILTVNNGGGSVRLNDTMTNGDQRIEQVRFADGTVWTHAQIVAMSIAGNAGNDTFWGSYDGETIASGAGNDIVDGRGGDDILIGGAGDDVLYGSGGNDIYRFARGDGNDNVQDFTSNWSGWGGNDSIEFLAGISPSDVTVTETDGGTDLLLTINNGGGSVRLNDTMVNGDQRIEQVRFADGTVWSHAQLVAMAAAGTPGDDTLWGSYDGDTLSPGAGNDTIDGRGGDDILIGGPGDDRLSGSGGNDTYQFNLGDGHDYIQDYVYVWSGWGGYDRVQFGAGISPADISVGRADGGGSYDLFVNGGEDAVTLVGAATWGNDYAIEEVRFADGTTWVKADLEARVTNVGNGADVATGTAAADTMRGLLGNDTLQGAAGDDTLRGDGGDDTLVGGVGNDVLNGGTGNDILAGDDRVDIGSSLLVNGSFDQTAGTLTTQSWGITATALVGWSKANASVYELVNSGVSGAVTGDGGRWLDLDGVAPGSNMDISQTVAGRQAGELLDLKFDLFNNTSVQSGSLDVVWNGAVVGSFAPTTGVFQSFSLLVSAVEGTNVLGFRGTGVADNLGAWLDNVRLFATASGTAGDDQLTGGAGNDNLQGGAGNDIYYFNRGDGSDTIAELPGEGTLDRLVFGAGIVPAELVFATAANGRDVLVTFTGGAETLTFLGGMSNPAIGIEEFRFADGTVWDQPAIESRIARYTAGPDVITGTAGDDVLRGGGGDDTISGAAGNDRLTGDDGNDTLDGGPGNDLLDGLEGDDRLVFSAGSDDYRGGNGIDTLDLSAAPSAATVDLAAATNQLSVGGVPSQVSGVETVLGTGFNDSLAGDAGANRLDGGAGADTLAGAGGDDVLTGGLGDDLFTYGGGANGFDAVDGGAGTDTIQATVASAVIGLTSVIGIETITGGALTGVVIQGSGGNDALNFATTTLTGIARIDGGAGNDTITGSGGNDTIAGGAGDDILAGGAGTDMFNYSGAGEGFDAVDGGAGTDTIQALAAGTVIGLGSVTGVETITGNALANVTISGSANADTLDFTAVTLSGIVRIDGGAGNDAITGSAANDEIAGGAGDDTLAGGGGNDTFDYSGSGDGYDAVDGGAGTDIVRAMAASTYIGLRSVAGIETITANGFADVHLTGSAVADVMNFSAITLTGIARIEGLAGDDTITATALADVVDGGGGNDTITGGAGDDTLFGGDGNDIFKLAGAADGFDAIDGGLGADTIQATAANAVLSFRSVTGVETVTANGLAGVSIAGSAGNDSLDFSLSTLVGITKIDAGAGNDLVLGSAAAETIIGGAGDDTLAGGGGNDTFQVTGTTSGFDAVDGGAGTDTIQAMAASTVIGLTSVAGIETITAGTLAGVYIQGSANNDTLDFTGVTLTAITKIDGGAGNDTITGAGGNDTIIGGAGDDTLAGGAGNDTFQVTGTASGFDAVDGGAGTDTISATAASTVIGLRSVTGVETISGGSLAGVYISGSGGDDTLNFLGVTLTAITKVDGGAGNDTITGNNVANTIFGGVGNDVLSGDAGNDTLNGDDGDDRLIGGLGNDTINGGNGIDTVDYSASTTAWTVNLAATASQGVSGTETDTISNVENVIGSGLNDTITGTTAANVLGGGAGNDRITGGAGNDQIDGGAGTVDVAVFAGLQASYSIVTGGGTIQIVDNQPTIDGNDGTDTLIAVEKAEFKGAVQVTLAPPIILDLDGNGVNLTDRFSSGAWFDWNGDGIADHTGWMGRGDGMLVFDRNHDGTVTDAGELSFVDDKAGAKSDLDGLSAFDGNHDGVFSAADAAWSDFRVWNDANGDGRVDDGEFLTMAAAGVAAISLTGTATERSWGMSDNIVVNDGHFVRTDGTSGSLGDVALNYVEGVPFFHHRLADLVRGNSDLAWDGGRGHAHIFVSSETGANIEGPQTPVHQDALALSPWLAQTSDMQMLPTMDAAALM